MCVCMCDRRRDRESSCTAKICIGAELGEDVLHDHLTGTCRINGVVSAITEIGRF